ncbi:unnamed protein product [Parnassius apollo]|uniref:(apollo) hypothetical protein n=1 Tax=Parnassius apollo TaxID=110799 RepID=A0A8S3WPX1_PARAO|nr:unnamed protein product [Parnassius apollo]
MYKNFIAFMLFCILHILSTNVNNFGTFKLNVTSLVTCKGPKRKDCCEVTTWMQDGVTMFYDITVKEDIMPTKGKIVAMVNGKPLIRLQMKKPCDHLFLKPLFMSLLNVTKDCVFVKGHYKFILDIEDVAQKYYGGMFLYGNMTFKSVFYSDHCNLSCTVVSVTFTPRNSTSNKKIN